MFGILELRMGTGNQTYLLLINVFGLFLRMGIEIKNSLLWKPNSILAIILIPLFYTVL